jgi:hypothetical protein
MIMTYYIIVLFYVYNYLCTIKVRATSQIYLLAFYFCYVIYLAILYEVEKKDLKNIDVFKDVILAWTKN